jgi:uncharacterized membrane protein YeaQ/YmgE (transglycosylase-associated protein family)
VGIVGLILFLVVVYIVFMLVTAGLGLAFDLIVALLVWGLIGWAAGKLTSGKGFGTLNNILLGLLGGVIGGFVFQLVGFGAGGLIGRVLSGVVGAVIVIFLARTFGNRTFGR